MSSGEEDYAPFTKKRKLQRACDQCRRKKIRCDGPERPDNRCSRCEARGTVCTYKEPHLKSSYPGSYVQNLESRLERMETLMSKLLPDGELPERVTPDRGSSSASTSHQKAPSPLRSLPIAPQIADDQQDVDLSDNDEAIDTGLIESLRKLSVSPQPYRYHGKSSGLVLIRTAIELRNQQLGRSGQVEPQERAPHKYPWLIPASQDVPLFKEFPPDDLLHSLVDLYFSKVNDMMPLLHKPTLEAEIKGELHLKNGGFGAVVLLVCANAARFTSDPRVLLEGTEDWRSAGWKWFQAVEDWRKVSLGPAQLHDLQVCVLMANFLLGSTAPQANWALIGSGLRMAVDVGAHRKKMYNTKSTIEDELWRRAFWILALMEWQTAYGLGRPASIHDEDIDVDLPTEIDDEYWTPSSSGQPPCQPEGKPSKVSFLVAAIHLARNLSFASRTVYSINRSKLRLGQGDSQWEEHIVAELDSSLNSWLDSLPTHLRWNPDQPDGLFLKQTATLYANYYHTQIAVHRPFMGRSRHDSPLSHPSTIICTNAARSTIQVLDILYKRTGNPNQRNMGLLFMAGVVLMMSVWGQKRADPSANVDGDFAVLQRAMVLLDSLKDEVQIAGTLRDLFEDLILAVRHPVQPPGSDTTTGKASTSTPVHSAGNRASPSSADSTAPAPERTTTRGTAPSSTTPMGDISRHAGPSTGDHASLSATGEQSMFDLDSLGFGDTGALFPPASSFGTGLEQHPTQQPSAPATALQGGDLPIADFAFMDETLSMWSNAPAPFGLADWGAFLNGANGGADSGSGV